MLIWFELSKCYQDCHFCRIIWQRWRQNVSKNIPNFVAFKCFFLNHKETINFRAYVVFLKLFHSLIPTKWAYLEVSRMILNFLYSGDRAKNPCVKKMAGGVKHSRNQSKFFVWLFKVIEHAQKIGHRANQKNSFFETP